MATGFVVLATAWFGVPSPRTATALTNCSLADESQADLDLAEMMLLDLVNAERLAQGLIPVRPSPSLDRAAAWMAVDMSGRPQSQMSHTDTTGRDPFTRMANCGYAGWGNAGENIAWGSDNVCTIFAMWMQSSGHRANMLDQKWRVIGVAAHGTSWVQDFGVFDDSWMPYSTAWEPLTGMTCSGGGPPPTPVPTASATITVGPPEPTPTQPPPINLPPLFRKAIAPMVVAENS